MIRDECWNCRQNKKCKKSKKYVIWTLILWKLKRNKCKKLNYLSGFKPVSGNKSKSKNITSKITIKSHLIGSKRMNPLSTKRNFRKFSKQSRSKNKKEKISSQILSSLNWPREWEWSMKRKNKNLNEKRLKIRNLNIIHHEIYVIIFLTN